MIASAIAPGRSVSTPVPRRGSASTVVVEKKTRTATGMTAIARRFSPRRAVSRSSVDSCAVVARGHGAGATHDASLPDERQVGVLQGRRAAADVGRRPAGDDPPGSDDHDPIRQPLDIDEVVAGQQDRCTRRRGVRRCSSRVTARASGSIPAVGSSRTTQLRPPDERDRQGQPLPFPTGQPSVRRALRPRSARPARAARPGRAGRRGTPRTGGASRAVVPGCRSRRPGASARAAPAMLGRPAPGPRRGPGPSRRPRAR